MWNTFLPRRLREHLPEDQQDIVPVVFRSIVRAQEYEMGTPTRDAINLSYRQTQQILAIGSLGLSLPLLMMMVFFKDIKMGQEDKRRAEVADEQFALAERQKDSTTATCRQGTVPNECQGQVQIRR